MALLDRAGVEHVAGLASLGLTEGEAEALAGELAAIVAHVAELATLDVTDVPPFAHPASAGAGASLRCDEVQPGLDREAALAAAPRAVDGAFAVPGFVE